MSKKEKKPEKTRRGEVDKGYKTIRAFRIIISIVAAIFSSLLLIGLIYAIVEFIKGMPNFWGL